MRRLFGQLPDDQVVEEVGVGQHLARVGRRDGQVVQGGGVIEADLNAIQAGRRAFGNLHLIAVIAQHLADVPLGRGDAFGPALDAHQLVAVLVDQAHEDVGVDVHRRDLVPVDGHVELLAGEHDAGEGVVIDKADGPAEVHGVVRVGRALHVVDAHVLDVVEGEGLLRSELAEVVHHAPGRQLTLPLVRVDDRVVGVPGPPVGVGDAVVEKAERPARVPG